MHQNSIWFLPHLVNIQTKNIKKRIIQKCWVQKKWQITQVEAHISVFWHCSFRKLIVPLLFCACLCVFSARFHMNFGLSLYSILLHYWFALEVTSSLHLLLLCNEYFSHMIEHYYLAVFIYSSAFLGSFCGACFYFPAFNFLLVNSWTSF